LIIEGGYYRGAIVDREVKRDRNNLERETWRGNIRYKKMKLNLVRDVRKNG
jgi:hypothetical protein